MRQKDWLMGKIAEGNVVRIGKGMDSPNHLFLTLDTGFTISIEDIREIIKDIIVDKL